MTTESTPIKDHLISHYFELYPQEAAEILNDANASEILEYLSSQTPEVAQVVMLNLDNDVASDVIEVMDQEVFLKIFTTLDVYHSAIIISRLDEDEKNEKLGFLPTKTSEQIKSVKRHSPHPKSRCFRTR